MVYKSALWVTVVFGLANIGAAIEIVPAYQVLHAKAGATVTTNVTIKNNETYAVRLTPQTKEWFSLPGNAAFKIDTWLKTQQAPVTLKPGETTSIPYEVRVPKKAKGELIGMISILADNAEEQAGFNMRTSVSVYVPIQGTDHYKGSLESLLVDSSNPTLTVHVLAKNDGNVHMRLNGRVNLYKDGGDPVAYVTLKTAQVIYPGESKTLVGELPWIELAPGAYTAELDLVDIDWKKKMTLKKKPFSIGQNDRKATVPLR